jgi:hypothetical protein
MVLVALQATVADTAHGAAPERDNAAADDSWDFRPSAAISPAEAASPPAVKPSESSAGRDSSSGGTGVHVSRQVGLGELYQPVARTAGAAAADSSRDPPRPTAAAEAPAVDSAPGRIPPPGAEDLTAEELAFFGYAEAPQEAATAAQVGQRPASGNSSDDSSSSDSDSDNSDDALGHAAADVEDI